MADQPIDPEKITRLLRIMQALGPAFNRSQFGQSKAQFEEDSADRAARTTLQLREESQMPDLTELLKGAPMKSAPETLQKGDPGYKKQAAMDFLSAVFRGGAIGAGADPDKVGPSTAMKRRGETKEAEESNLEFQREIFKAKVQAQLQAQREADDDRRRAKRERDNITFEITERLRAENAEIARRTGMPAPALYMVDQWAEDLRSGATPPTEVEIRRRLEDAGVEGTELDRATAWVNMRFTAMSQAYEGEMALAHARTNAEGGNERNRIRKLELELRGLQSQKATAENEAKREFTEMMEIIKSVQGAEKFLSQELGLDPGEPITIEYMGFFERMFKSVTEETRQKYGLANQALLNALVERIKEKRKLIDDQRARLRELDARIDQIGGEKATPAPQPAPSSEGVNGFSDEEIEAARRVHDFLRREEALRSAEGDLAQP